MPGRPLGILSEEQKTSQYSENLLTTETPRHRQKAKATSSHGSSRIRRDQAERKIDSKKQKHKTIQKELSVLIRVDPWPRSCFSPRLRVSVVRWFAGIRRRIALEKNSPDQKSESCTKSHPSSPAP